MSIISRIALIATALIVLISCNANLQELTRRAGDELLSGGGSPSSSEIAAALRQALNQGVDSAIGRLGRANGFNASDVVRIALPEDLRKAEELLRKLGQGKYVDEFELSLNRAAEKAVPKATSIFVSAIRDMSINDAVNIIKGPEDAATRYFQRTSEARLQAMFQPIVSDATETVGVTRNYKKIVDKAGPMVSNLSEDAQDLDGYVTRKATDALFLYIAEEERRIRENPLARTTDLLKEVFGYYSKS